jgi:hypothetical protein
MTEEPLAVVAVICHFLHTPMEFQATESSALHSLLSRSCKSYSSSNPTKMTDNTSFFVLMFFFHFF